MMHMITPAVAKRRQRKNLSSVKKQNMQIALDSSEDDESDDIEKNTNAFTKRQRKSQKEHLEIEIVYNQNINQPQLLPDHDVSDESKDGNSETDITSSIELPSNHSIDKKALWKILKSNQCPITPQKYEENGGLVAAYYYNDDFWIQDENDKDLCRMLHFENKALKQKAKDNTELMLAVDQYISYVHINSSYEVYKKLTIALDETMGNDDGNKDNDAYQKLIPTNMARAMFITVFFTTLLNAYFIAISIRDAAAGRYNTVFMNVTALIMSICEAILYANVLFGYIIVMFARLIYALYRHKSTYYESKTIAIQLRNLSTLSILRYLPSIELVTNYILYYKERLAKLWVNFLLLFKPTHTKKNCDIIFAIPVFIIETFAPFLALYAILVKIKLLGFAIEGDIFRDWELSQYITFVAFLNQVAGLRVLRKIETASIQHFVFSGSDAELSKDELLILDKWWNITLLSAVSNLGLNWYDNMVFWCGLDPQKIQLLLKNHVVTEKDRDIEESGGVLQYAKENDLLLKRYDQETAKRLSSIT